MAEEHLPKHLREDGVPPPPALDSALVARWMSGSKHTHRASEEER